MRSESIDTRGRVLITGAGGFLGSHISNYFGSKGYSICAVGRLSTSPDNYKLYSNLWKMCGMTLPDIRFTEVLNEFQPELLVHCASSSSVADSVSDPYGDFQKTVEVCAFTLEAVRKHAPDCHFILLSSASVYGNPEKLPIPETARLQPVSPYGYHKMLCETLVEEYVTLHRVNAAILRIFSAYGERLNKQVIFDICKKLNNPEGKFSELFGTGSESRDFIHAYDIAQAIKCIHCSNGTGIFNLASGTQTTISELVNILIKLFNSDKQPKFNGKTRHGDPTNWQADISKIQSIGFKLEVELVDGLANYVKWFKRSYNKKTGLITI